MPNQVHFQDAKHFFFQLYIFFHKQIFIKIAESGVSFQNTILTLIINTCNEASFNYLFQLLFFENSFFIDQR